MKKITSEAGFTLIELLLAMTIFTAVMVIATVGFIGMNRTFTRGVIRKQLSEAAQLATEDITRALRNSTKDAKITPCNGVETEKCIAGYGAICFDNTRYFWPINTTAEDADGGLFKDAKGCKSAPAEDRVSLVDKRYVVRGLSLVKSPSTTNLASPQFYTINGTLTSGSSQALKGLDGDYLAIQCKGTAESSLVRSCAVESFNFVVSSRSI